MTRHAYAIGSLIGVMLGVFACDLPECITGPSNLTPEATASCVVAEVPAETEIDSAGAELLDDGTLVLTLSSLGLECGTRSEDFDLPDECTMTGWVITVEIPPELAQPGVIELTDHPEITGTLTVLEGSDGGQRGLGGQFGTFVGQLELLDLGESCVSGVLHGFGTGDPDPSFGGPELEGGFVAPRC